MTTNESLCFNYLLAITPFRDSPVIGKYVSKVKGVSFKIYGQTESTKENDRCGDTAVRDLFEYFSQDCDLTGYGTLIDRLNQLGYRAGLTYQSLPYDF